MYRPESVLNLSIMWIFCIGLLRNDDPKLGFKDSAFD